MSATAEQVDARQAIGLIEAGRLTDEEGEAERQPEPQQINVPPPPYRGKLGTG